MIPVLFTFCIQDVLKLKKNNPGAKRLTEVPNTHGLFCCLPFHIYSPVTTLLVSNTLPKIPLFFPKPKVFVSVVQKARSRRQSKNIFTQIPPPHTQWISHRHFQVAPTATSTKKSFIFMFLYLSWVTHRYSSHLNL